MVDIGIIGGSGFYEFFEHMEEVSIDTHYGKASDKIAIGTFEGKKIAFIPRHGKQHQYAPHNIPYKANLAALKELGVKWIIAPTACGSLNEKMKIGDFVITDQYINFTHKRDNTFRIEGVEHISMAQPYCEALRELAIKVGNEMGITVHKQGTMIVIEGPMFSTKAESRFYKLSDRINSLGYTRNFAGSIVLVVYTLGASLIDLGSSSNQCSLSSSLISSSYSSLNFLDRGFNLRSDRFVSCSLSFVY